MNVPVGSVCYLEVVADDVDAVCRVYEGANGWDFGAPVPELGSARVATLPDESLCGVRAPMSAEETPVTRAYVRVADLDAAVREAEERGGRIILPPMEIPGRGRIAMHLTGGVQHAIWQLP